MRNQVKRLNPLPAIAIAVCLGAVFLGGCRQTPTTKSTQTLDITVSILPQKYFVERIGGDNVNVNVMVQPGSSPATYEPKPQQLQALSEAEAYMSIGVPFEAAWLDRIKAANPTLQMIDTTNGIELMPMVAHHHHHEEEGEEEQIHHDSAEELELMPESADPHHHHHEEEEEKEKEEEKEEQIHSGEKHLDPHIWVSPKLVKIQAQTIYEALTTLDPTQQAEYQASLEEFLADIDALDAEIRETLAGIQNRKFMVFHPSWGYFARDYNLEMIPIEIGGQEPSAAELTQLIAEAKEDNIRVIFVQPEFSTQAAETIANQIGGEIVKISPLEVNWLENLRNLSQEFANVLAIKGDITPFFLISRERSGASAQ